MAFIRLPSLGLGVAARNAVLCHYKGAAGKSGRSWTLTKEKAEELFRGDCHYCGRKPSHYCKTKRMNGGYTYSGIDRIDSSRGYDSDNVVSCCRRCNVAKNDMTYSEFVTWVELVYVRLHSSSR